MRTAAIFVLATLVASPLAAQGRGGNDKRVKGVPPGHMPPPGQCRVWHDGRPPGQQPRPTNCREAERVASRDRNARVIYGADRDRRDNTGVWGRDEAPSGRGRAIPRDDRSPYPGSRGQDGYGSVPFDNGYKDGFEKGREDVRDRDSYDPVRHSRYRSADRGYNQRYGTKEQYKLIYRDGFEDGYDDGYRGTGAAGSGRPGIRGRFPWPF